MEPDYSRDSLRSGQRGCVAQGHIRNMTTFYVLTTGFFVLYSCYVTQLDVPSRQTTPTRHIRVLDSSFRCLDKEGKRPQIVQGIVYDESLARRLGTLQLLGGVLDLGRQPGLLDLRACTYHGYTYHGYTYHGYTYHGYTYRPSRRAWSTARS